MKVRCSAHYPVRQNRGKAFKGLFAPRHWAGTQSGRENMADYDSVHPPLFAEGSLRKYEYP